MRDLTHNDVMNLLEEVCCDLEWQATPDRQLTIQLPPTTISRRAKRVTKGDTR
jgi:hypothetical protein